MKRSAAGVRLNRYRSRSTPYRVSTSCSSCPRPPASWRSRSRTDAARSVGGLCFTLDPPTSRAALFGCDGLEIRPHRSEEHTSELQSRLHLVCRLLLEKKKKKSTKRATRHLY